MNYMRRHLKKCFLFITILFMFAGQTVFGRGIDKQTLSSYIESQLEDARNGSLQDRTALMLAQRDDADDLIIEGGLPASLSAVIARIKILLNIRRAIENANRKLFYFFDALMANDVNNNRHNPGIRTLYGIILHPENFGLTREEVDSELKRNDITLAEVEAGIPGNDDLSRLRNRMLEDGVKEADVLYRLLLMLVRRSDPAALNMINELLANRAKITLRSKKRDRFRVPQLLHHACTAKIVEALLAAGADPMTPDLYGRTPLHTARAAEITKVLLAAGADPMAPDCCGQIPLHTVRTAEIARVLLAAGADPMDRDGMHMTPLHTARTAEIARVLLAAGADPMDRNGMRMTPLHTARTDEIIRLLEEAAPEVGLAAAPNVIVEVGKFPVSRILYIAPS